MFNFCDTQLKVSLHDRNMGDHQTIQPTKNPITWARFHKKLQVDVVSAISQSHRAPSRLSPHEISPSQFIPSCLSTVTLQRNYFGGKMVDGQCKEVGGPNGRECLLNPRRIFIRLDSFRFPLRLHRRLSRRLT